MNPGPCGCSRVDCPGVQDCGRSPASADRHPATLYLDDGELVVLLLVGLVVPMVEIRPHEAYL